MSFSPRPSPFKRPESPANMSSSTTIRAASPTTSPIKTFQQPTRSASPLLSPERQSPFVRRPSQLGSERSKSPFARPSSRLSVAESSEAPTPSRNELDIDPFISQSPSPTVIEPSSHLDGPSSPQPPRSPSPILSPSPSRPSAVQRPSMQRTATASTAATIRAPLFQPTTIPNTAPSTSTSSRPTFAPSIAGYNHVPQPLLRSMRESFEVLDCHNSGTITSADVSTMLDQLGMANTPAALSAFFPPNMPSNLNLARFLDTLSGPMADLSHPDELTAAFGAFDVDDSGQIDLNELKEALLSTAPEDVGMPRMSERQADAILSEFAGRRAFGGKGVLGKDFGGVGGKARGEVFRYRDFMASISGAGGSETGAVSA